MANWLHDLALFMFAVLAHWQALATGGIVTAGIGVYERRKSKNLSWQFYACVLGAFCLYSIFAAWQDEHRNTLKVEVEKSAFAAQASSCNVDLKAAQASLEDKKSMITTLQTAFTASQGPQEQQAANINTCINTLAKMNPNVNRKTAVIFYPIWSDDERKIYEFLVFITTNQNEPRAEGHLQCDEATTLSAEPNIVTPSGDFTSNIGGNQNPANTREMWLSFQNTSSYWGPTTPIVLKIRTSTARSPKCTFTPK